MIRIQDNKSLARDTTNTSIINTNVDEYRRARDLKQRRLHDAERINILEDKMDKILNLLEEKL